MLNRRKLLKLFAAPAGAYLLPLTSEATPLEGQSLTTKGGIRVGSERSGVPELPAAAGFTYCLNMATIRGHKLGFIKDLETASQGGYHSVEIWLDSLQAYLDGGGTPQEARKRLDGLGLKVENAIGFAEWIPDDEGVRKKGLEQLKREMDLLSKIGCKRIAAPPTGATEGPKLDLDLVAERYRQVLLLGDQQGVVPQLEMWGFSKNCSRVSEVMHVALGSGHSSARVLLDVFHLYKGGSSIDTLPLVGKGAVEILHMNDYTANFTPATITDADRVHPGDGVAPIRKILAMLQNTERPLVISEEVFNQAYYRQDPLQVVKTGLAKMKLLTDSIV